MQIPDSSVTNRGREPLIESDAARYKGRTRTVSENCYSALVNIASCCEVIHDVDDRRLQIRTADSFLELDARAVSQKIHRSQIHSAVPGVARRLVGKFFISMSRFAHANDHGRPSRRYRRRQEIALQRITIQPGNLDDLTTRREIFNVAAGGSPRGPEYSPLSLFR